jgi:zona occludens toxin (predicted ATPase)
MPIADAKTPTANDLCLAREIHCPAASAGGSPSCPTASDLSDSAEKPPSGMDFDMFDIAYRNAQRCATMAFRRTGGGVRVISEGRAGF